MRTALVIVALIVPVIALALPDDATLSRLLVGTWHGHRHDTQYQRDFHCHPCNDEEIDLRSFTIQKNPAASAIVRKNTVYNRIRPKNSV